MRGVKSGDVIQALSTLHNSNLERQREQALFQQLRRRERPSIEDFFTCSSPTPKSNLNIEKELLLYMKVRPRRLKPLANTVRPSPVGSPIPQLDGKTVLRSLRRKPRPFQGGVEVYTDWDVHCSLQMKRQRPNFRFNAIRDMKSLQAYKNPFTRSQDISP